MALSDDRKFLEIDRYAERVAKAGYSSLFGNFRAGDLRDLEAVPTQSPDERRATGISTGEILRVDEAAYQDAALGSFGGHFTETHRRAVAASRGQASAATPVTIRRPARNARH